MARGVNVFESIDTGYIFPRQQIIDSKKRNCIFISHQSDDKDACRAIANYLMDNGINVYFDEYDNSLKHSSQTHDLKGVVRALQSGINNSTHMLCVLSNNTLKSQWVPWEVGYGYDQTDVNVLTLKDIPYYNIPDFLKVVPNIGSIIGLDSYIKKIKDTNPSYLYESLSSSTSYFSKQKLLKYLQ